MALPGPKPKPPHLKVIEGNPGKRPVPTDYARPAPAARFARSRLRSAGGDDMHITSTHASKIRLVVRAALVTLTAYGLRLSADQVAATQLLAEAVLQLFVREPAAD